MEQHLIDANNLGVGKANPGIFVCKEYAHGWNNALQAVVEAAPTVDPEALPIVRQLRAELARVTAERDVAVECIYNIEDDLDRGNDNDWAREHISEWSGQQK